MLGKRKSFRVKGSSLVKWSTVDMISQGEATVVNSSVTGIAMVIYKDIDLPVGSLLFVEPVDRTSTTIQNKKVKIAWVKKTSEGQIIRYHCGVEFIQ